MIKYKLFYNADELEIYGNLKIGSKKLKQNNWFTIEPQTISFSLLKFNNPRNRQEELNNNFIYSVFDNNNNSINGIIPDIYITVYENNNIIYVGLISLLESKYEIISGKAFITCYDVLKVLGVLSDEDSRIINNTREFTGFLLSLQSKITDIGFFVTLNNTAILPSSIIDEQYLDTGKDNDIVTPIEDYPLSGLYYTSGTDNDILYFYYINADCNAPNPEGGFDFDYISYQYILISFEGLKYSLLVNEIGTIDVDEINNPGNMDLKIKELEIKRFQADMQKYWKSFVWFIVRGGYTYQEYLAFDIDYKIEFGYLGRNDIVVTMNGNLFTQRRSFGGYIENGFDAEDDSNIVNVLKMYLMANDYICYASGSNINIIGYNQYSSTIILEDINEEIISIHQSYQTKNIIEDIPNIDVEQNIWLKILNEYYSNKINSKFYVIKLRKVGRAIKAGDRIVNSTYDVNLFIFQIDYNIDKPYFTVTGVNI